MSGKSRMLSSVAGSIFFASQCAAAVSSTADALVRNCTKIGTKILYMEIVMGNAGPLLEGAKRNGNLASVRGTVTCFTPWRRSRADSMCCRSTSIACMSKIVGALVRCKRFYEFSNQPPEFLHGALGAFAQRSFEFRERHLDGIEVWRICRQIAECCTDSVDCLAYPVDLVGP